MKRILAAIAALWLCLAPAFGQSTINIGQPATQANLTSLLMRQQLTAAASDINGIIARHPATSLNNCPAQPVVMEDCVVIGSSPYIWYIWTGSTGGWAKLATINPSTGVVTIPMNPGDIAANPPLTIGFPGGVATLGLSIDTNFTVNGGNALALNSVGAGNLLCNPAASSAEPSPCSWNQFASRAIGTTANTFPLFAGGAWGTLSLGTSVNNPGSGTLESVLPVQTNTSGNGACTSSCTYTAADFFKKTRRSNGGAAMSDTLPAAGTAGLINGTRIVFANADVSASLTINAGSGTVMASGGATDVIGPGRDVAYEYDLAATQWRGAYNTRSVLLGPNNLSDLSSTATAITNLFGTDAANTVFAGPSSGGPANPTFRALVNADLPSAFSGKTYNGLTITPSAGTLTIPNNASAVLQQTGNFTLNLTTLANATPTFPSGTHTLMAPDVAATISALYGFNNATLNLNGTTGAITLNATATAGSSTATFPAGSYNVLGDNVLQTLINKTIDTAGPNTIKINGNTLSASAGTATLTLPNSTDTLMGRATTDTPTNKTIDTAGPNTIKVAGVDVSTAWTSYVPSLSCGSATFSVQNARFKTLGKTTFLDLSFSIAALNTGCTSAISFTLPNTPNSDGGMAGRENGISGKGANCNIIGGSTSAVCSKADFTAVTATDAYRLSGVYENQ